MMNTKSTKTKTPRLGDIAWEAWSFNWVGTPSEKSRAAHVKSILEFFGENMDVRKLDTEKVLDYVDYLRDKKQNDIETRNKKISAISVILDYAHTKKYITSIPKLKGRKKANNQNKTYISQEEENIILPFMQNHELESMRYFGDFWAWSVDTGLRPSESRRITRDDVFESDGIGWVVRVGHTKTNDWRVIPLTKRALEVFQKQEGEKPWAAMVESRIRNAWEKVRTFRNRVGDKTYKPYLTRHTTGSRLLQNKVDITLVRDVLGHSNIQTTLRYAKNNPTHLVDAIATLQR